MPSDVMSRGSFRPTQHRTLMRALVLSLLLPALFLAQVLDGRAALLHEHDAHGQHVHLLSAAFEIHAQHVDSSWHDAQHDVDVHDQPAAKGPVDVSLGIPIKLPQVLVAAPIARGVAASTTAFTRASFADSQDRSLLLRPPPPLAALGPERIQVRRQRSGISLLLGSSRALLI